eukprot:TRINITY_DN97951_c0_g1_i1.p1 TRINITY_DN97951_c0_g1~~TRINITY_DN97951_c0_g1_i1.p1  ORF type:complete len:110 (-),score=11.97 TRINITY_DN97951_c0_g1_i1:33-362(-)
MASKRVGSTGGSTPGADAPGSKLGSKNAGSTPAADSSEGRVWHWGKYRLHLDRLPELLVLLIFAFMVGGLAMEHLELSRHMAVPIGLFAAVQMQKIGNRFKSAVHGTRE